MSHSLGLPVGVGHEAGDEHAGAVELARPQQLVEVLLQLVGVRPAEVQLDLLGTIWIQCHCVSSRLLNLGRDCLITFLYAFVSVERLGLPRVGVEEPLGDAHHRLHLLHERRQVEPGLRPAKSRNMYETRSKEWFAPSCATHTHETLLT